MRTLSNPRETDLEPIPAEGRSYSVRAVERVCSILNLLQESTDGVSLAEIAEATSLPKTSAFRYLWTLEAHRYVERHAEDGIYTLGIGFAGLPSRQIDLLRQRTHPRLEALRDELGETVNLGILDGYSVTYLDVVESRRGVKLANQLGARDALHSTALGKVIASTMPEPRVREILTATGMPARTANTLTDVEDYLAELARIRRLGYATDDGENEIDGRCVAVAIPRTRLAAAISLSAPAARFPVQDVSRVATELRTVADRIADETDPAELEDE